MRQKRGDSRLRRWQNSPSSVPALYSSPVRSSCTEKLIVVGCDSTPSRANNALSSG
ncbi:hypothetical protein NB689_002892 [Xanthomonas sacchari]|nr:hypothetical protein [Xanthomonas sacchari]